MLQSDENYKRFVQLYVPPIVTNELTETIFSEFEKVFESRNAFSKFEFNKPELENDFNEYRKKIGDFSFWQTQGFETFKNDIDNVLIVDLPKLQADALGNLLQPSDKPEPYYYILDIDCLIDICNTKVRAIDDLTGKHFYYFKTEYVIFHGEDKQVFVFDDIHYQVYLCKDGADPVFQYEVAHNLGYCPGRSFWTTPLNSKTTFQKRGPITNSLSELDYLLFLSISYKYFEMYGPYPIYAIYKGQCDYKDMATNTRCLNGYLVNASSNSEDPNNRVRCPKCASKIKLGPGNILELKAPKDKDDPDLMLNPMKIIPADIDSLEFLKKSIEDKKAEILGNCIGHGKDPENNQAQNEKQIDAGFESRISVLIKTKRNFEIIHGFALDTIARLRYGPEYISGTVNYGDQFFAKDENTEVAEYNNAVNSKLPTYDLAIRRESINAARYKNNPDMVERLKVLRNLEPWPDYGIAEVIGFRKDTPEIVPVTDLIIKMNFNSFIDRFEREQANVLLFARALDFDRKINLIKEEILKYAQEIEANSVKAEPPSPAIPPVPAAT